MFLFRCSSDETNQTTITGVIHTYGSGVTHTGDSGVTHTT